MNISIITASLLVTTLATSAYAVENLKVNGSTKLWYQTNVDNRPGAGELFEKRESVGLAEINVGVKAELYEGLEGEVNVQILDSLGLENDVIRTLSNATVGHKPTDDNIYDTQWWASTANLKYTKGNTITQVGRMSLNTPLLFTEKWNAGYNTFEGAVLRNTDIPGTTLTAMYITGNNGTGIDGAGSPGNGIKIPSSVTYNGRYYGFGTKINGGSTGVPATSVDVQDGKKSLYSFGAQINPMEDLNINLWYYNISSIKDAYWADASYSFSGVFLGIQNSGVMGKEGTYADGSSYTATGDNMITAVKLGYTLDKLNVYGAYSFTDDKANAPLIANFSTNRKTKIYTSAIVQDGGIIGRADTKVWKVHTSYKFDTWKLVGFVQNTKQGSAPASSPFRDSTEYDLVASTKIGKHINLKGIYMHREYDATSSGHNSFNFVRLIAALKY